MKRGLRSSCCHKNEQSSSNTLQPILVNITSNFDPSFIVLLINELAFHDYFLLGFQRSISEDSLRRYVRFASESCIQELLSASDSNRAGNADDGWKVLTLENGVEISKRRSGSLHTFRSRWLLRSVSPQQFITVANAIDAAKVNLKFPINDDKKEEQYLLICGTEAFR